jgi:hypothetical protein
MEKVTIQFDADLSPLQDKLGQLKSSGLEQLSTGANEASSSIDKLSQSAKNMPMNVISQGFDEATTSIKENSQAITENVSKQQSMKAELRDLKNRLQELEDQGKDNTKEFEQMALRAGQLSDQIGDTSSRIRVLGDDSKYIKAVSQAIGAMASAYSVAQGASALFGSENKEVEKALLKVNAAMAIANGLQQINEVLQKQSTVSVVANTVAQRAYTFVVGESTGALKVFRVALAATGIGALIIGIWAAYEAMTAWNNKVQEAAETQKKLNEQIEKHRENLEKVSTESEKERNARKGGLDDMKRELQLLEAKGATESAIYQQKRKILNEELGNIKILAVTFEGDQKKLKELLVDFNNKKAEIRALDAAHTKAVNAEIVKDTQKAGEANFNTLEADYQKEIVLRQEMLSKMNQDSAEARDLKKEIIDAELAYNLLILSTQYTNNQDYENKTKSLKLKATKDKEAVDKDYKQNSENSEKEFNAFMEQVYADNEQAYADSILRKQEMDKANRQAAKDQAIASIQTIANAEFEIDKANRDAKLQADIDALEQRKENELKNKDLTEAQKLAIQTKYGKLEAEAKKKAWEAEQDAKKKQAIINGALAITNIWATYGGTNPVLAGILTAASIISTATQVRVIDSQPVPKFAKGKNLDGYEGMAIIGEAGRELRLDSDGSMKMYNRATLDHVNADSIILPNNLTEALLKTNIPAMNLRNMNAVTKQNISAKLDIDYKKLARTLGEELKNSQKVSVNIDEKGFETRIMNGISERRVIDNRYKL